jgi:hypothetical protein
MALHVVWSSCWSERWLASDDRHAAAGSRGRNHLSNHEHFNTNKERDALQSGKSRI